MRARRRASEALPPPAAEPFRPTDAAWPCTLPPPPGELGLDGWPVVEPGRGTPSVPTPVEGRSGVEGVAGSFGFGSWGTDTSGTGGDGVLGSSTGAGGSLGVGGKLGVGGRLGVGGTEGSEGSEGSC